MYSLFYVGQIELFAGNFPPYGWAFCDGTLLNIPEYNTLFDILGTTHGGDGELTFALPNYTNQVAVGTGGGEANYQFGQTVGTRPIIVAKDPADRVKTVPTLGVSYIISLYGDSPS